MGIAPAAAEADPPSRGALRATAASAAAPDPAAAAAVPGARRGEGGGRGADGWRGPMAQGRGPLGAEPQVGKCGCGRFRATVTGYVTGHVTCRAGPIPAPEKMDVPSQPVA
jgi:hypothetical protein